MNGPKRVAALYNIRKATPESKGVADNLDQFNRGSRGKHVREFAMKVGASAGIRKKYKSRRPVRWAIEAWKTLGKIPKFAFPPFRVLRGKRIDMKWLKPAIPRKERRVYSLLQADVD